MSINNPQHPATPDPDLEASLGRLRPTGLALTRDTLMFHAGQAAARRHARRWQAATATLGLALALSLLFRPAAPPARIVYVQKDPEPAPPAVQYPREDTAPSPSQPTGLAYLTLRNRVLLLGVNSLPSFPIEPLHTADPLPQPERLLRPQPSDSGKGYMGTIERLFNQGV